MRIVLFCLLEVPHAWAQRTGEQHQLAILDAKKASHLLLQYVSPEYPVLARLNYIQGRVRVQLIVSPAGRVSNAHVLSGNPLLAAAALDSVRDWRYRPYVADGSSSSFATAVDINFTLHAKNLDLPPRQAESDFSRQVKPPELLTRLEKRPSTHPSVQMRLLVNAEGKVIDWDIIKGIPSLIEGARKSIERWSFRPARWGTLSVPWYFDVDVPVYNDPVQAATGSPDGG